MVRIRRGLSILAHSLFVPRLLPHDLKEPYCYGDADTYRAKLAEIRRELKDME